MSGECILCGKHCMDCDCNKLCDKLCDDHIIQYKTEWGYHNLMVIAAFRYCLGRRTYIVSSCTDWLIYYWPKFDDNTKKIIVGEIQEALDKGYAGDQCDIQSWLKVLENAMD